jgi:Fic family protein
MVQVWKPIEDLPEDWSALTDGELGPLLQFWNDQRADLEQTGALAKFSERLAREWSIETGQIEGVYDIDRGITQTLIEKGINADLIPRQPGQKSPELVAAIMLDHQDVLDGLFQFVRGERHLSKNYIHQLHAALLQHQDTYPAQDQFGRMVDLPLHKGVYKRLPNSPLTKAGIVHQYCPPEQVEPEMERLLAMHEEHERKEVAVEVQAAWLHHRFTQIHPYPDGNGRLARALATLVFIKKGWFPFVVTRDEKSRYIDALEAADEGQLQALVAYFVEVQKWALFQAVQTAADLQPTHTVDEAINAAKLVLKSFGEKVEPQTWLKAKETTDRLLKLGEDRFIELAGALSAEIGKSRPEFEFSAEISLIPTFSAKLPYVVKAVDYGKAPSLVISNKNNDPLKPTFIELQAHLLGSKSNGLIGILVQFDDSKYLFRSQIASQSPFLVNYAESYENTERRFRPWLEESLVNALTMWRKTL